MYYETTDGNILKKGLEASIWLENFFSKNSEKLSEYNPKQLIYYSVLTDKKEEKDRVVSHIQNQLPSKYNLYEIILMMILGEFSYDAIWDLLNSLIYPIRNLEHIQLDELKYLVHCLAHLKNNDLRYTIVDERALSFINSKLAKMDHNTKELINYIISKDGLTISHEIRLNIEVNVETIIENSSFYSLQNVVIKDNSKIDHYILLLNYRVAKEKDEYEIFYLFKILNFDSVNAISKEIDKLQGKIRIDVIYPISHRIYLVLAIILTSILPFIVKPDLPLIVYILEFVYGLLVLYLILYFIFFGEIMPPKKIYEDVKNRFNK